MKTILIVDDDDQIRTLQKMILSKEGFAVIEAEDGASALEIAKAKMPDLIISDVMMENVNGFMLYEFLRDDPKTENIPMILVTGKAYAAGAWNMDPHVGYLQKPVTSDDLLAAVKKKIAK
jgi:twitching motility two-component system response regulator PilH